MRVVERVKARSAVVSVMLRVLGFRTRTDEIVAGAGADRVRGPELGSIVSLPSPPDTKSEPRLPRYSSFPDPSVTVHGPFDGPTGMSLKMLAEVTMSFPEPASILTGSLAEVPTWMLSSPPWVEIETPAWRRAQRISCPTPRSCALA